MSIYQPDKRKSEIEQPVCHAARLPSELLILIFRSIDRKRFNVKMIRPAIQDDVFNASLVCRAWNNPATLVYYELVQFRTVANVFKFYQALLDYPHLRSLVKVILFPARLRKQCPPKLMRTFVQIIHLVDSLNDLTVTTRFVSHPSMPSNKWDSNSLHVVPIGPGKHSSIRRITLYGDGLRRGNLPSALGTTFSNLTFLALNGIRLARDVDTSMMPVLPELARFYCFAGNAAFKLDAWLQACPKLKRYSISKMRMPPWATDEPPLGILRAEKITSLELYWMYSHNNPCRGSWLLRCPSVKRLQITWDIFSSKDAPLPTALEQLQLTIRTKDDLSIDVVRERLKDKPNWDEFVFMASDRQQWHKHNEEELKKIFEEAGVQMKVDQTVIWYQKATREAKKKENKVIARVKRVFKSPSKEDEELLDWEWAKT